ncbi:MAG: TIGR02391 family protein, partial [Bacteroidia bacterium]|nr:TIGR02391 family protein [Bacteroidia bacterium]
MKKNIAVNKGNETTIKLYKIKRKTGFNPSDLAYSLAKAFQVFNEEDFKVQIIHNRFNKTIVDNEIRYKKLNKEFTWDFPLHPDFMDYRYEYADKVKGTIISALETVPADMRGIALFSRSKLVNNYDFYDVQATSHGYSYLTGWLHIDFIDEWQTDVISTNRQSLNWEMEETEDLKQYLQAVIYKIYNEQRHKRRENKKKAVLEQSGINL